MHRVWLGVDSGVPVTKQIRHHVAVLEETQETLRACSIMIDQDTLETSALEN